MKLKSLLAASAAVAMLGVAAPAFAQVCNYVSPDGSSPVPCSPTNPLPVTEANGAYTNITSATTTTVKSGAGAVNEIAVNTLVASATITVYDNTSATGTKIGTWTLPSTITGVNPFVIPLNAAFSTGLTIVTSGTTNLTVVYH